MTHGDDKCKIIYQKPKWKIFLWPSQDDYSPFHFYNIEDLCMLKICAGINFSDYRILAIYYLLFTICYSIILLVIILLKLEADT